MGSLQFTGGLDENVDKQEPRLHGLTLTEVPVSPPRPQRKTKFRCNDTNLSRFSTLVSFQFWLRRIRTTNEECLVVFIVQNLVAIDAVVSIIFGAFSLKTPVQVPQKLGFGGNMIP